MMTPESDREHMRRTLTTQHRDNPRLAADEAAIRQALELIICPGDVFEIRAFKAGYRSRETYRGFYTLKTLDLAVQGAVEMVEKHNAPGVYVTLNPVNSGLLSLCANRIAPAEKGDATSDADILRRRWLLIDCDPVRKAGISSTDQEFCMAVNRTKEVCDWLQLQGFKDPLECYSGNGGHGLLRIDMPNDAEASGLIKDLLDVLDARFSDDKVKVELWPPAAHSSISCTARRSKRETAPKTGHTACPVSR